MSDVRRLVNLKGRIDRASISQIKTELGRLAVQSNDPVTLMIDCGGGQTREGLVLYWFVRKMARTVPIIGLVRKRAASMAMVVLQACTRRLAFPGARILVHPITFEVALAITLLTEAELVRDFHRYQRHQERIYLIFTGRTGTPRETVVKLLERAVKASPEEAVMTAREALTAGLIDEIVYDNPGLCRKC